MKKRKKKKQQTTQHILSLPFCFKLHSRSGSFHLRCTGVSWYKTTQLMKFSKLRKKAPPTYLLNTELLCTGTQRRVAICKLAQRCPHTFNSPNPGWLRMKDRFRGSRRVHRSLWFPEESAGLYSIPWHVWDTGGANVFSSQARKGGEKMGRWHVKCPHTPAWNLPQSLGGFASALEGESRAAQTAITAEHQRDTGVRSRWGEGQTEARVVSQPRQRART